jgi:hypothetical protein
MPNLHPVLRTGRKALATLLVAFIFSVCSLAQTQSQKPPQQLNLPDPTPRPPDLERQYGSDPVELARQQQLAALKIAQLRQQVIQATDKLLQLAQELETDVKKRENGTTMMPQVIKAEQIEKLAKSVKERTKLQ